MEENEPELDDCLKILDSLINEYKNKKTGTKLGKQDVDSINKKVQKAIIDIAPEIKELPGMDKGIEKFDIAALEKAVTDKKLLSPIDNLKNFTNNVNRRFSRRTGVTPDYVVESLEPIHSQIEN